MEYYHKEAIMGSKYIDYHKEANIYIIYLFNKFIY